MKLQDVRKSKIGEVKDKNKMQYDAIMSRKEKQYR